MKYELRKWRLSDAKELAAALNNKRILNNQRDGLPFPYTEQDATEYITAVRSARAISTAIRRSWATIWRRNTGASRCPHSPAASASG